MELLIKGDEIGYISREDDQSFGLFCPVVQIYDDAIELKKQNTVDKIPEL